jgi:hypothetical protein
MDGASVGPEHGAEYLLGGRRESSGKVAFDRLRAIDALYEIIDRRFVEMVPREAAGREACYRDAGGKQERYCAWQVDGAGTEVDDADLLRGQGGGKIGKVYHMPMPS